MFPWKNHNQPEVYYGCANPDGSDGPWCPTELADDGSYVGGSGKWGYCDMANWECSNGKVGTVQNDMALCLKLIYFD